MAKIPFLDLKAAYRELEEEIQTALLSVASRGAYVLGPEVAAFEEEFARFTGAKHCVGVGSGLDALFLSLKAFEIGPGDEVIVPSHTFIATWLAVSYAGATPVPVDVDLKTGNIDPGLIEQAITAKTKAIIPVHLYGQPADLDPILERGLIVIDDAAQAHGAKYKGRRIGSLSHASAWSFYPGKNLGALGDGGAITTNSDETAAALRLLRNYGSQVKYRHERKGINSRLDDLQAAVLRVKLRHLEAWNQRRGRLAKRYTEALSRRYEVPHVPDFADPVWHLYVIRSKNRDALQQSLANAGIETLIHYPLPPSKQQAYGLSEEFPIANQLAAQVLSLPIGPHLSEREQSTIIEHLL